MISPDTSGEGIRQAFIQMGLSVEFLMYRNRKGDIAIWQKVIAKSKYRALEVEKDFNRVIVEELPQALERFKPDFVLIIKGERLYEAAAITLRQVEHPIILWTLDSLTRYPQQMDVAPFCNYIFFQDGGDLSVDFCSWLPLGIDPHQFAPNTDQKKYDIIFTGYLRQPDYKHRLKYLQQLLKSDLPGTHRVALAVSFGSRFIPSYVKNSQAEFLGRLPMDQYAQAVTSSKICVNILQSDGKQPLNPLFFGVGACGTCQVIEYRPYFDQWLQAEKHFVPVTLSNFISTLHQLLEHENYQKYAQAAFDAVIPAHTYTSRAQTILDAWPRLSKEKGVFGDT